MYPLSQTNIAVAHRVPRRDVPVSTERSPVPGTHKPPPPVEPASADEPLDLTKPLDLSKRSPKPASSTPDLGRIGREHAPNVIHSQHATNAGNRFSVTSPNFDARQKQSKLPPLRSTKYPLQRGLAYVQPRQAAAAAAGRDVVVHEPRDKVYQKDPAVSPERKPPTNEKVQSVKNYAAMQQRVRTEAANIAALQAQATQAAQEAVKKAMQRHAALTMNKANAEASEPVMKKPKQASNGTTVFPSSQKRPQVGRTASVKPMQRHITPGELQTYIMQRQLAQLSAIRGSLTEKEFLLAYQQMMEPANGVPHALNARHYLPLQTDAGLDSPTTSMSSASKRHAAASGSHSVRGPDVESAGLKIDNQNNANRRSAFASQVKAREQMMIKQQQELIMRQQQQLLEDVNNNRKLLEYAKVENERKAIMNEFNKKQFVKRMKIRDKQDRMTASTDQLPAHASSNSEYLKALAAYNAKIRSESSQGRSVTSAPASFERPNITAPKHKKGSTVPNSMLSRRIPGMPYHPEDVKLTLAAKRSRTSFHGEDLPRKRKSTPDVNQPSTARDYSPADLQAGSFTQQMYSKTHKQAQEAKPFLHPSGKKLASIPVRDRLMLARMSEQERLEYLHLSNYSHMMEDQAFRAQYPEPSFSKKNHSLTVSSKVSPLTAEQIAAREEKKPHQRFLMEAAKYASRTSGVGKSTSLYASAQDRALYTPQHGDAPDGALRGLSRRGPPINDTKGLHPCTRVAKPPASSPTLQPQASRINHLPSYDDAIAAQQSISQVDKLTPDIVSTVARQLVNSSQEWLKRYLSREQEPPSRETIETVQAEAMKGVRVHEGALPKRTPSNDITSSETQSKVQLAKATATLSKANDQNRPEPKSSLSNEIQPLLALPKQEVPTILTVLGLAGRPAPKDTLPNQVSSTIAKKQPDEKSLNQPFFEGVSLQNTLTEETHLAGTLPTKEVPSVEQTTEKNGRRCEVVVPEQPAEEPKTTTETGPAAGTRPEEHDLMQADAASLGVKERALQRAIIRFNEAERRESLHGADDETSTTTNPMTTGTAATGSQKRRRRKLSKFRRRIRQRGSSFNSSTQAMPTGRKRGRPRRSSLPTTGEMTALMRSKFQDFVPTIIESRTRNKGSDRVRNYRSMYDSRNIRYDLEIEKERAKVMAKRRRLREYNVADNASATETDNDTGLDEDYVPTIKRARGRPRSRASADSRTSRFSLRSRARAGTTQKQTSPSDCDVSSGQPLRVVLDENTPNHIKMKFVNLRSMSSDKQQQEQQTAASPSPPRRGRGRPPKAQGKRKTKTRHVAQQPPDSPQPPKLELMSPCNDKENENDYEDFVQDPDFEVTGPEMTPPEYTRVVRPDPPQAMRKQIVNKKLGETMLHRAASLGNMEIMSYCVDYRVVDVNTRDNAGYTALHETCVHGHLDVASYLLSHGADVNASAADGTRPIHDAVDNDRTEMVRLLLAFGADPLLPTYTGRRTTKLALGKSSEMKTLLFGYLQDVNGDRSKLEDSPESPLDYQWSFQGSCEFFDENSSADTYIFKSVPGPDDDNKTSANEEEDEGIFFEISDQPTIPSFNIRLESQDKFRNWLLLNDVTTRLSVSRQDLLRMHPDLTPVDLPTSQFEQCVQESQVSRSGYSDISRGSSLPVEREHGIQEEPGKEEDGKEAMMTLVELNDTLRKVLSLQVEYVK